MRSLRQNLFLVLLSFPALAFVACNGSQGRLAKVWFFTDHSTEDERADTLLTAASFIELRPDGRYAMDWGHFSSGTWKSIGGQLLLEPQNGKPMQFQVGLKSSTELFLNKPGGIIENFEGHRLPNEDKQADPFSPESNRWRIPAAAKESDEQIRHRLHDHCKWWVAYFNWALDNQISFIDVRNTPTPIKIYGNGFTLKPLEDLPAVWKSYFYDEEDCRKANDMLADIFRSRSIAWAHTENKYKLFVGAFQQLERYLK